MFMSRPGDDMYSMNMSNVIGQAMIDISTMDTETDIFSKLVENARNIKGLECIEVCPYICVFIIHMTACVNNFRWSS